MSQRAPGSSVKQMSTSLAAHCLVRCGFISWELNELERQLGLVAV